MMRKVLVLGSAGYLGKYLTLRLMADSDNVVYSGNRTQVDLRDLTQCIQFFYGDRDYDEIYQLAANSGNMEYLLSHGYSYGDSTLININIIKALKIVEYEGKILFPSSLYAYDTTNRYGLEKLYNEQLYMGSGLNARVARLFSIYGPGEKLDSEREKVTTAFCRKFIESDGVIDISGNPEQVRYFLHVSDAIDGLIIQMRWDEPLILDFAGNEKITFGEMVRIIEKSDGRRHEILYTNENRGEKTIVPTTNVTKTILEWDPVVTFEEGMDRLYRWVKNELH
jgi:nucleoside-diphosphate-sugar epimerase